MAETNTPAARVFTALAILLISLRASEGVNRCLSHLKEPNAKILHFNDVALNFTLQSSSIISHQLTTEVFKILLEEALGYQRVNIIENSSDSNVTKVLNNFYDNYNSHIPNWMINMEVLVMSHFDIRRALGAYEISECGQIAPPGRYGWFIPSPLHRLDSGAEYWRFFKDPHKTQLFDITDKDDMMMLQKNSIDTKNQRFFCHESYCEDGVYIPQQCKNLRSDQACALMLSSFPETTKFITEHIVELKLYVKVMWLGNNLGDIVDDLTYKYLNQNVTKSLVFLEWTPGYFTVGREKYTMVALPNCDNFKSLPTVGCKYEMTRNIKLAWSRLADIGREALEVTQKMTFSLADYEKLLSLYDPQSETSVYESACVWLKNNQRTWESWLPVTSTKGMLYVGGIFPLTGAFYNAAGIVKSAIMAQKAINENPNILSDYNLVVLASDGKCKADMVMRTFIDYIYNSQHDKLIGVLGPACSETVEPLAGISKHYSTVVISYSAEGSSFSDRSKYPYFFRTIGENKQYIPVYLHFLKAIGWKRIASLTEDGQKYTEYISNMGDLFQAHGISFVANIKFPRERKETSLTMYLQDLKKKRAKIIIADIYDKVARAVMCQAYKLHMTSEHGYVWFLPAWLPVGWYNTTYFNEHFKETVDCSIEMMISAMNGHFTISHAYFASNETVMQENKTVGEWLDNYVDIMTTFAAKREKTFNVYTELNNDNFFSDYAGYAYDAVWIYALAFDKLLKLYPGALTNIHNERNTRRFVEIIGETDFTGVSGKINFYGGTSRYSIININQWLHDKYHLVGAFHPNIFKNRSDTFGGHLDLNVSSITWLTPEGAKPEDGYSSSDECLFEPLAEFFDITCRSAIILVYVISFSILGIMLLVTVTVIKNRYDRKIKLTEDYMRSIGLDTTVAMKMTNLDKWETAREKIVLNRKLGEGAFGTVYGGEALLDEDKGWVAVAVKTLKVGSNTDEKVDFLSEAESMKRFDHKNIVKLLGVCTKNEPVFTIMEFMLYGDLKTYLLARRHLVSEKYADESDEISSKKLTSMALDVARALSYLADLKYVHRDVACRNCLVNSQRVVKLGDFGMTRLIFENDYYRFSRKGMLPIRWMAPESLGLGIFSPASDVWSFGVVLYEIITFGSFPFQAMSNNEVLESVKNGNTLKIPSGVKPQLEGLIKSCWNHDYKNRPNASEVVNFLANNSRLLSPCLDVPISSVLIDHNGPFDILPEILGMHAKPPLSESMQTKKAESESNLSLLNSLNMDNPNYISTEKDPGQKTSNRGKKHNYMTEFVSESTDEESVPFV